MKPLTIILALGASSLVQAMCPAKVYPSDYCIYTKCGNNPNGSCAQQCYAANGQGSCWSEWNDGYTRNYHCDGEMSGWHLTDMHYRCWGNLAKEFWCQCG